MTNQFWLSDPTILLNKQHILELWPNRNMDKNDKLNAISRLIILLTIVGFLYTRELKMLITGLITLVVIVLVNKIQAKPIKKVVTTEAFTDGNLYELVKDNFSEPVKNNPLMNVMLTDIHDNPQKKPAAPTYNPVVTENINNATKKMVSDNFNDPTIEDRLFKDLGDNFSFDQSMRTWYATPNTQVPNDQKKFAEFCYGGMTSCKEGNEIACSRN
tara:strand:+ start:3318 stop:3962 length:645 start_codon:yes stop_codon:yes gene_type:complete